MLLIPFDRLFLGHHRGPVTARVRAAGRLLHIILCLTVAAHIAAGAISSRTRSSLSRLKAKCKSLVGKANRTYVKEAGALGAEYAKKLTQLEASLKQAGSLDGLIAARAEIKRFNEDKTVTPENVNTDSKMLGRTQTGFMRRLAKLSLDKNKAIVSAFRDADQALSTLVMDLTKRDKIQDASEVRRQKTTMASDDDYSKAEFELVETTMIAKDLGVASTAPVRRKPPANVSTRRLTRRPEKVEMPAWDEVGGDDVTIYASEAPASELAGTDFDKVDVVDVDRILTLRHQFSVDVRRASSVRSKPRSKTRDKAKATRTYFRLTLACKGMKSFVAKPTLRLDYFGRKYSRRAIIDLSTEIIKIPNLLGRRKVIIDTKGAETLYIERTVTTGTGGSRVVRSGNKFDGVVISLFNDKKELVCQVVSEKHLVEKAPSSLD